MIHVRLFCGAGMSTSLLAKRMQQYAEDKGIEAVVDARPVSAIKQSSPEQLAEIDCALLGPQVAFEKAQLLPPLERAGVPAAIIPMQMYGMVDGAKVMQMALDMIEEAKK